MSASAHDRIRLNLMQAFRDAAEWRLARIAGPCGDCTPARQCDDHRIDADLVEIYRGRFEAVSEAPPGELESALEAALSLARPLGECV